MDHESLTELFAELGFRSFAERAAKIDPTKLPVPTTAEKANYHLVDTPEALADLVTQLNTQTLISVDTETTHVQPRCAEIVGYSFAFKPAEAYYVAVRGPAGERVLDPKQTLEALRPVLENPQIRKLGQNLKYDMIVLRVAGVTLAGLAFDTMIASYLARRGRPQSQPRRPRPAIFESHNHQNRSAHRQRPRTKADGRSARSPSRHVRRRGRRHSAPNAPDP